MATTSVELAPEQPRGSTVVAACRSTTASCACACTGAMRPTPGSWRRRGGSWRTRTRARRSASPDCSRSSTKRSALRGAATRGRTCPGSWPRASRGPRPRCSRWINRYDPRSPRSRTTRARPRQRPQSGTRCAPPRRRVVTRRARRSSTCWSVTPMSTVVDFDRGSISASAARLDLDVAQALVTTALRTGVDRAVARGRCAAPDELLAAQRYLSSPALDPGDAPCTQAHEKGLLDELTTARRRRTRWQLASPVELRRVKPLNIVMFVALLVRGVGDPGSGREPRASSSNARRPPTGPGWWSVPARAVHRGRVRVQHLGSVPPADPARARGAPADGGVVREPRRADRCVGDDHEHPLPPEAGGRGWGRRRRRGCCSAWPGPSPSSPCSSLTAIAVGQEASLSQVGGSGSDHEDAEPDPARSSSSPR